MDTCRWRLGDQACGKRTQGQAIVFWVGYGNPPAENWDPYRMPVCDEHAAEIRSWAIDEPPTSADR